MLAIQYIFHTPVIQAVAASSGGTPSAVSGGTPVLGQFVMARAGTGTVAGVFVT